MPFRDALARLALADAHRFEQQNLDMLRAALKSASDDAARQVLQEIIAEEEIHCRVLADATHGRPCNVVTPPPDEAAKLPKAPDTTLPPNVPLCETLQAILKKEQAAVTFYDLLAERTPIPAFRAVFKQIADAERGHAHKLESHVRGVCGRNKES